MIPLRDWGPDDAGPEDAMLCAPRVLATGQELHSKCRLAWEELLPFTLSSIDQSRV